MGKHKLGQIQWNKVIDKNGEVDIAIFTIRRGGKQYIYISKSGESSESECYSFDIIEGKVQVLEMINSKNKSTRLMSVLLNGLCVLSSEYTKVRPLATVEFNFNESVTIADRTCLPWPKGALTANCLNPHR